MFYKENSAHMNPPHPPPDYISWVVATWTHPTHQHATFHKESSAHHAMFHK